VKKNRPLARWLLCDEEDMYRAVARHSYLEVGVCHGSYGIYPPRWVVGQQVLQHHGGLGGGRGREERASERERVSERQRDRDRHRQKREGQRERERERELGGAV
jgi:hypothetical protein